MTATYEEYESIEKALRRVRRRWKRVHVGGGILLFVAALLASALLALGLDMVFFLRPNALRAALGMALAVAAAAFLFAVALRLFQGRSNESIALLIEGWRPDINNGLINAVRLARDESVVSRELVSAAMRETLQSVERISILDAVDRRAIKRYGLCSIALLIIAALLVLFMPGRLLNAAARLVSPSLNQARVGSVKILEVKPGDRTGADALLTGSTLSVSVKIEPVGSLDVEGSIEYLEAEESGGRRVRMRMTDDSAFQGELRDLKHPLTYRVHVGGSASRSFTVEVVEPPAVTGVDVDYAYPPYTGLEAKEMTDTDGAIRGVVGSTFGLRIHSNHPLKSALMLLGPKREDIPFKISRNGLTADLPKRQTIEKDTSYVLEITDKRGHGNRAPIQRYIRALPDAKPSVKIILPGKDETIAPGGEIKVRARAADDFGLTSAQLVAKLRRGGATSKADVVHTWQNLPKGKRVTIDWTWGFDKNKFRTGDIVRYYIKVADNNNVSGPGVGRSGELEVRILDAQQARKEKVDQYGTWQERLQKILEDQLDLRKDTTTLEKRVGVKAPPGAGAPKPGKPPLPLEKKKPAPKKAETPPLPL